MKKIMFNDKFGLTKAVLDGRKTQTRRVIPQATLTRIMEFQALYYEATLDKLEGLELFEYYFYFHIDGDKKFPYNIGEIVAVAQSYKTLFEEQYDDTLEMLDLCKSAGWENKMFVRADLMPYQIRITNVRIEKLQDIPDEDCIKEGVIKGRCGSEDTHFMDAYYIPNDIQPYCEPRDAFAHLINKVSKKDVWSENPYVFVYDFELVK